MTTQLTQKNPQCYKAADIIEYLNRNLFVLRVTDFTSLSPYDPYEGFTATDYTFMNISRNRFRRQLTGRRNAHTWQAYDSTLDSMVDHILGGWDGYIRGRTGESSWISTTTDLDWAVYEISRRLAKLGRMKVQLSVINTWHTRIRGVGIRPQLRVPMDTDDRELAVRFATASSEMLWYGKIFEEDVMMVTNWTWSSPGFKLPPEFRLPPRMKTFGGSWLDNLCFDPCNDTFYQAQEKIQWRRNQVYASQQPQRG